MDHAAQHGEVHRVTRVEDFPFRTEAGLNEHVVCAGELQEQDVHEERGAADLLR